jgi:hypothetical protein
MAHITIIVRESGGLCENCGTPTKLIKPGFWKLDSDDCSDDDEGVREIADELTAHYCEMCDKITSISLNSKETKSPVGAPEGHKEDKG